MKTWHSITIGVAIVAGFVAQGTITAWSDHAWKKMGYEMQQRMLKFTPREISLGDTQLLYLPRISYHNLSIDVDYEFFEYENGKLRKVALVAE